MRHCFHLLFPGTHAISKGSVWSNGILTMPMICWIRTKLTDTKLINNSNTTIIINTSVTDNHLYPQWRHWKIVSKRWAIHWNSILFKVLQSRYTFYFISFYFTPFHLLFYFMVTFLFHFGLILVQLWYHFGSISVRFWFRFWFLFLFWLRFWVWFNFDMILSLILIRFWFWDWFHFDMIFGLILVWFDLILIRFWLAFDLDLILIRLDLNWFELIILVSFYFTSFHFNFFFQITWQELDGFDCL